jgi:hypothetical protein
MRQESSVMKKLSASHKTQAALALASFFLLVGHKSEEGCGGTVIEPEPTACAEIYAPVCSEDGVTYGNACEAELAGATIAFEGECGGVCLPGEHLELICEEVWYDEEYTTTGVGGAPSQPPLPEPYCYEVCIPDNPCGEGYHEEWICEGTSVSVSTSVGQGGSDSTTVGVGGAGGDSSSGVGGAGGGDDTTVGVGGSSDEPWMPPPEECYSICVPDDDCGDDHSSSSSGIPFEG